MHSLFRLKRTASKLQSKYTNRSHTNVQAAWFAFAPTAEQTDSLRKLTGQWWQLCLARGQESAILDQVNEIINKMRFLFDQSHEHKLLICVGKVKFHSRLSSHACRYTRHAPATASKRPDRC